MPRMEERKKLGMYIKFDSEKDKDLIELVDKLGENRQLGKFIVNAMRIVNSNEKMRELALNGINLEETQTSLYNRASVLVDTLVNEEKAIYNKTMEVIEVADTLDKLLINRDKAKELIKRQIVMRKFRKDLEEIMGIPEDVDTLTDEIKNREKQIESHIEMIVATVIEKYSHLLVPSVVGVQAPVQSVVMQEVPVNKLDSSIEYNKNNTELESAVKVEEAYKKKKEMASASFFGNV